MIPRSIFPVRTHIQFLLFCRSSCLSDPLLFRLVFLEPFPESRSQVKVKEETQTGDRHRNRGCFYRPSYGTPSYELHIPIQHLVYCHLNPILYSRLIMYGCSRNPDLETLDTSRNHPFHWLFLNTGVPYRRFPLPVYYFVLLSHCRFSTVERPCSCDEHNIQVVLPGSSTKQSQAWLKFVPI